MHPFTFSHPERIHSMDVLRGIAILAIFWLNLPAFSIPLEFAHSLGWDQGQISQSDRMFFSLNTLLLDGTFITLFTLLFGAGMALLHQQTGPAYLQRRLWWLCLFGLLHLVLIWPGDILLSYALSGGFILYRGYLELGQQELRQKVKKFAVITLLLYTFFTLLLVAMMLSEEGFSLAMSAEEIAAAKALHSGPYAAILRQHFTEAVMLLISFPLSLLWLNLSLMLLGVYLLRSNWFQTGFNRETTLMLAFGGITLNGLTLMLALTSDFQIQLQKQAFWSPFAAAMLALSLGSVVIHSRRASKGWLQSWLAPCGKMAFTLYLSQSLVMVGLLRFVVPDWYLTLTKTDMALIAILGIVLQLLLARWYLQRFQQGPLETLWRKLSQRPANKSPVEVKQP